MVLSYLNWRLRGGAVAPMPTAAQLPQCWVVRNLVEISESHGSPATDAGTTTYMHIREIRSRVIHCYRLPLVLAPPLDPAPLNRNGSGARVRGERQITRVLRPESESHGGRKHSFQGPLQASTEGVIQGPTRGGGVRQGVQQILGH